MNGLIIFIILLVVYFMPVIVAMMRNHRQTLAIFMTTLLLGWTVFGWIFAIIWACTTSKTITVSYKSEK